MILAEAIRAIEKRYSAAKVAVGTFGSEGRGAVIQTGWPAVDAVLGGGLESGALHEWFGVSGPVVQASSTARGGEPARRGPWTPPVCVVVHLVWQALKAGSTSLWTVWIGRRCFPYPNVLVRENGQDRRLLDRSIFVAPRDASGRLWAIDLALRSPAVGVVVADGSEFNMAASRRVQLVARDKGRLALLVRPAWERQKPSSAHSRWLLRRQLASGGDVTLRVNPRWSVELLRCKGVQPERGPSVWALEWDRATSTVSVSAAMANQAGDAKREPTSESFATQRHRSA